MRCPKCQYLGFEPSPRCKNCGHDFAFDEAPALTLVADPEAPVPAAEFDLQLLDDAPLRSAGSRKPFDLDELLATGRAGRESAPAVDVVAGFDAIVAQGATEPVAVAVSTTPAPEEVERIVREAARVFDEPLTPEIPLDAPPVVAAAPPPVAEMPPSPAPAPPTAAPAPVFTAAPEAPRPRVSRLAPPPVTTELPLFMQGMGALSSREPATAMTSEALDAALAQHERPLTEGMTAAAHGVTADDDVVDLPLVKVPATPRAPLSVRRATPDPSALRAKYAKPGASSGDLLRDLESAAAESVELETRPAARLSAEPTPASLPAEWLAGAPAGPRLAAAAIDLLLLGGINALVIWLTLSVCGLQAADARLLPLAPIAVFFLLIDGGYLVLFTAACGQTLGKMAAGIRVVGTTTGAVINDRLSVGQAVARTIGAIAASAPLGIGFWLGLFGDHRALHDRIAHTRVVRV